MGFKSPSSEGFPWLSSFLWHKCHNIIERREGPPSSTLVPITSSIIPLPFDVTKSDVLRVSLSRLTLVRIRPTAKLIRGCGEGEHIRSTVWYGKLSRVRSVLISLGVHEKISLLTPDREICKSLQNIWFRSLEQSTFLVSFLLSKAFGPNNTRRYGLLQKLINMVNTYGDHRCYLDVHVLRYRFRARLENQFTIPFDLQQKILTCPKFGEFSLREAQTRPTQRRTV